MRHALRSAHDSWAARAIFIAALVSTTACQNRTTAPTPPGAHESSPVDSSPVPVSALMTIAEASTLEQVGAGQTATSRNYLGQSVTIPGTSSYNNLRFNWDGYGPGSVLTPGPRGPLAVGDLFLLTQEYLGLPGDLGPSTPGYLARSEGIDQGQYVFSPSVTLNGGAKYWFYSSWRPGTVGSFQPITGFSQDTYGGGDMYIAPELTGFNPLPFRKAQASWRVISPGPPIVYDIPPPDTYIDANFKLMGAPTVK
jgi:hypothetical protein